MTPLLSFGGKYRSTVALLGGRVSSEPRSMQRAEPTTIGKTVMKPRKRTSVGGLGGFPLASGRAVLACRPSPPAPLPTLGEGCPKGGVRAPAGRRPAGRGGGGLVM